MKEDFDLILTLATGAMAHLSVVALCEDGCLAPKQYGRRWNFSEHLGDLEVLGIVSEPVANWLVRKSRPALLFVDKHAGGLWAITRNRPYKFLKIHLSC